MAGELPSLLRPCPYCLAGSGERCRIVNPVALWSWVGRHYDNRRFVHAARREA